MVKNHIARFAVTAGVILGIALGSVAILGWRSDKPTQPRFPLGDTIASITLKTIAGDSVLLRQWLGNRPALIYVFGPAQCAGCSNLGMEFQIVRDAAPRLQTLLIGSGAAADSFAHSVSDMGIERQTLIDEKREFLRSLGLSREPVVVLVDSSGRIVLVDERSAPRAAQYPMGRILHDLQLLFVREKPAALAAPRTAKKNP